MYRSQHVYTQTPLFERPAQTPAETRAQHRALRRRQQSFAALHITERTALLSGLADRLSQNRGRLARMVCEEVGRCLRECEAELDKSVELIRYYAKLAPEFLAGKTIATQASLSGVSFEPLGVVLAVMPWNYPVWQVLRFAVPALCAGNACWVKPAPSVGRVSSALFELAGADLPLQAAWLAHEDTEAAIAASDALAFTGSTETGRRLAALAGTHLKKSVLELGGSNAFIVLPDADLAQAAEDLCYSRFRDAGQSCNAAKRLIVCDSVADRFIALLAEHTARLRTGDPILPETTLAPLHRADLRARVHAQAEDAQRHGARLLCGGTLPEHPTAYPATLIDGLTPQCRMWHEEVFGPALGIIRVPDADAAVAAANATRFGLGASLYTRNMKLAHKLAGRLQAGSVFINRHTSSDLRLPFGGIKDSGYGRELSEFGLYEFVNVKAYWQK